MWWYDIDIHLANDDVLEHCPRYSKLLQVVQRYDGEMWALFIAQEIDMFKEVLTQPGPTNAFLL